MPGQLMFDQIISKYGATAKAKLSSPAITGAPEDNTHPIIGDRRPPSALDKIQPDHWLPEYTEDLLNLLHVLDRRIALEPAQASLLDEICAAPLLTEASLTGAGALASAPVVKRKKAKAAAQPSLFD